MAATAFPQTGPSTAVTPHDKLEIVPEVRKGSGWLFFAASMLGIAGVMRIFDSLWAFRYDGALPTALKDALFGDNLTTYGWVWLGVGALLILSSFLVVVRSQFGRWVGFFAAAVGAVTAMAWMPYYPVWSLLYVAIAVMVFYALARYGGKESTA